jgi:cation:H+ antiporter
LIAVDLLFLALGTAIVWRSSRRIDAAAQRIAAHHGLPPIVRGAVLTAVASSFPELSSVLISTLLHGAFELGVAAVVGSAIFNILVIPACSVLAGGTLRTSRELVFKESLFYLISVSVLLLTFSFAVIYHPTGDGSLRGDLTRGLACVPLGLYAIYLFIQYQDSRESGAERQPDPHVGRAWAGLLFGMLLVAAGVELLVRAALDLGATLGSPAFLWGLTVVAAGTSLPDLFISIREARAGHHEASISNVLGSNIFDLLVAAPLGVLVAGATTIDFRRAVPMVASLTIATIALFLAMRLGMALRRADALVLLFLYAAFLTWLALEAAGILHGFGGG